MKIKDIASVCRRTKMLTIFTNPDNDQQYVSNGYAIYRLCGLPYMTENTMLTVFNVEGKELDKWHCHMRPTTDTLSVKDFEENEVQVEKEFPTIVNKGKVLLPLATPNGIVAIDPSLLKPCSEDYQSLWVRENNGTEHIVVKSGMEFEALILPIRLNDEALVADLYDMANRIDVQIQRNKQAAAYEAEKAKAELDLLMEKGKPEFKVLPEDE